VCESQGTNNPERPSPSWMASCERRNESERRDPTASWPRAQRRPVQIDRSLRSDGARAHVLVPERW
jgi:hypothetical protein